MRFELRWERSYLVVNDNCAAVKEMFDGYNSRKIFADEYWDDKAACAAMTGENAQ